MRLAGGRMPMLRIVVVMWWWAALVRHAARDCAEVGWTIVRRKARGGTDD